MTPENAFKRQSFPEGFMDALLEKVPTLYVVIRRKEFYWASERKATRVSDELYVSAIKKTLAIDAQDEDFLFERGVGPTRGFAKLYPDFTPTSGVVTREVETTLPVKIPDFKEHARICPSYKDRKAWRVETRTTATYEVKKSGTRTVEVEGPSIVDVKCAYCGSQLATEWTLQDSALSKFSKLRSLEEEKTDLENRIQSADDVSIDLLIKEHQRITAEIARLKADEPRDDK